MYRGEIENGKWQAPYFVLHFLDYVGAAVPVTALGSCICMLNTTTYWWWWWWKWWWWKGWRQWVVAEVIKQDGNVNASDVRYLLHICVVFDVETTISHIIRGSQIPLHVHFDNQTFFGKRAFLPLPVQERKWEGKKGKRARRLEVKTVVKSKKENRKPAQTTVGHICSLVRGKISEGFFYQS